MLIINNNMVLVNFYHSNKRSVINNYEHIAVYPLNRDYCSF